jgi:Zn-dependent protease with chaperone function
MKLILAFLNCNQAARFLMFIISFALNMGHWETSLELVIASSFLPFFGYLAIAMGQQNVRILYYETQEGSVDPKLTALAREQNPRISKVVVKDIDRTNAYASNFTASIILTRKLVNVLSDDETKAILYHEISHISAYPAPVRVLVITFIFPALLLFLYSVLSVGFYALMSLFHQFAETIYPSLFVASFVFCLILLAVERNGIWAAEYNAGAKAAYKVEPALIIAALEKMVPPERINCDSPTHPSLRRRIAAIRAHCNDHNTRRSDTRGL